MSSDADKVRAAADHIEKYGLHKGGYSPNGHYEDVVEKGLPCCTMGALSAYGLGFSIDGSLTDFLGGKLIGVWNDAPERTAEEVVTTLRAFADTLETA